MKALGGFTLSNGTHVEFQDLPDVLIETLTKIEAGREFDVGGQKLGPQAQKVIVVLQAGLISPKPGEILELVETGAIAELEVINLYNAILDFASEARVARLNALKRN